MNILDENSKNLELLYKTKNTNLTIYKFFPNLKKLSLKEKSKLLSSKSGSKSGSNSNISKKKYHTHSYKNKKLNSKTVLSKKKVKKNN